jgi:hypothetical protein
MLPLGGRHAQPASWRRWEPPCSPGVALAIIAIILIVFLVLLLIGSSLATSVFRSGSNGKELTISRPRRRERPPLAAKWRWPPESCKRASYHLESLDSVGQRRGPQPVRALSLPQRHSCLPSSEVVLKRAGKARDSASSRGSPPVRGQIRNIAFKPVSECMTSKCWRCELVTTAIRMRPCSCCKDSGTSGSTRVCLRNISEYSKSRSRFNSATCCLPHHGYPQCDR